MVHCWNGYTTRAWGADELLPVSGSRKDNWGGMGARLRVCLLYFSPARALCAGMTIVDSLDTLWIMGMKSEFAAARDWVAANLHFGQVCARAARTQRARVVMAPRLLS